MPASLTFSLSDPPANPIPPLHTQPSELLTVQVVVKKNGQPAPYAPVHFTSTLANLYDSDMDFSPSPTGFSRADHLGIATIYFQQPSTPSALNTLQAFLQNTSLQILASSSLPIYTNDPQSLPSPPVALGVTEQTTTINNILTPNRQITWIDDSTNETHFLLQKDIGNGLWQTIATIQADLETFTEHPVTHGTYARYQILATNALGSSLPSNIVTLHPLSNPNPPPLNPPTPPPGGGGGNGGGDNPDQPPTPPYQFAVIDIAQGSYLYPKKLTQNGMLLYDTTSSSKVWKEGQIAWNLDQETTSEYAIDMNDQGSILVSGFNNGFSNIKLSSVSGGTSIVYEDTIYLSGYAVGLDQSGSIYGSIKREYLPERYASDAVIFGGAILEAGTEKSVEDEFVQITGDFLDDNGYSIVCVSENGVHYILSYNSGFINDPPIEQILSIYSINIPYETIPPHPDDEDGKPSYVVKEAQYEALLASKQFPFVINNHGKKLLRSGNGSGATFLDGRSLSFYAEDLNNLEQTQVVGGISWDINTGDGILLDTRLEQQFKLDELLPPGPTKQQWHITHASQINDSTLIAANAKKYQLNSQGQRTGSPQDHLVLLLPARIAIRKKGETEAPLNGLIVKNGDTLEFALSKEFFDKPNQFESIITWQQRQLKGDGSYTEWQNIGNQAKGTKFEHTTGVGGIYQVKALITNGGEYEYRRLRDEKTGNFNYGSGLKDQPDSVGVCDTQIQIDVCRATQNFYGSTDYETIDTVASQLGFPEIGPGYKCNIFVAHRATSAGASVPRINGIFPPNDYPPTANQWGGTEDSRFWIPLFQTTIDHWILQSQETYVQPGWIVSDPISPPTSSGHCGIVDYDGEGIAAGVSGTVNKLHSFPQASGERYRTYQP